MLPANYVSRKTHRHVPIRFDITSEITNLNEVKVPDR